MSDWSFEDFGPEFDEHVAAHLPGYMDVQRLVALIASFRLPPGGHLVDIGASTGRTVEEIALAMPERSFNATLYDADASMLEQAVHRLRGKGRLGETHLVCTGLPEGWQHSDADLTLMMWVLQFVPPADRLPILVGARRRSWPDGTLLVAAKTTHLDVRWQDVAVAALDDYKADQGVSADERAAKTKALRGTMHAVPTETYLAELVRAGWVNPTVIWRWHVWTVIGAHAS